MEVVLIVPVYPESPLAIRRIILDGSTIWLEAEVLGKSARCPSCRTNSTRVHDRYIRRPVDLPWRGHRTRLSDRVRRFCCDNPTCNRSTFVEYCGKSLPRYARRTLEASDRLLEIGLGAEAGARIATKSGLPTSPDTLLRLTRRLPPFAVPTPRVLGIDDLALRRRQVYATIFVDLETHRPIDLVEGREADLVESWLRGRSGIEYIVRDRSGAYADGARAGAPQAKQVADRLHLIQNASNALDELLRSRKRQVEYLEIAQSSAAEITPVESAPATALSVSAKLSPTKQRKAERKQARVARWRQVKEMREAGQNISQIARAFRMCRRTVRQYLATQEPPHYKVEQPRLGSLKSPMLQPFVPHPQERWQTGCHNVAQLLREIQVRGYTGSRTLLVDSLKPWRPTAITPTEAPTSAQERALVGATPTREP